MLSDFVIKNHDINRGFTINHCGRDSHYNDDILDHYKCHQTQIAHLHLRYYLHYFDTAVHDFY